MTPRPDILTVKVTNHEVTNHDEHVYESLAVLKDGIRRALCRYWLVKLTGKAVGTLHVTPDPKGNVLIERAWDGVDGLYHVRDGLPGHFIAGIERYQLLMARCQETWPEAKRFRVWMED